MAEELKVIGETAYLRLVQRGKWGFVQRRNASGVIIIIAVTAEKKLLFVEQYRPPVDAVCIEFPAGLAGDKQDAPDEPLVNAAQRELLEETGFAADHWEEICTTSVSAGLTDERITFFIARDLTRKNAGGGVEGEDIKVHEIPLAEVDDWLESQIQRGGVVGARIFAGLYFLHRRGLLE